jgi:hypothetical protein
MAKTHNIAAAETAKRLNPAGNFEFANIGYRSCQKSSELA